MIVGLGAECRSKLRFRLLRAILAAVAVLVAGLGRAQAEDAVLVPCDTLHLKVAGTGPAECRVLQVRVEESEFLFEVVRAPVASGVINIARERSVSNRAVAEEFTVRTAADELGQFPRTEDWGPERNIAGYTVSSFHGIANNWEPQCIAFVRRAFAVAGGYREQVMGVYCTPLPSLVDDATARDVLATITVK